MLEGNLVSEKCLAMYLGSSEGKVTEMLCLVFMFGVLHVRALWGFTLAGEDTALSCRHPGVQAPFPSRSIPTLAAP